MGSAEQSGRLSYGERRVRSLLSAIGRCHGGGLTPANTTVTPRRTPWLSRHGDATGSTVAGVGPLGSAMAGLHGVAVAETKGPAPLANTTVFPWTSDP